MSEFWPVRRLGDFSNIRYGYTEKASSEPIGPRFLRITDIKNGGVSWDEVPYCKITDEDFSKYQLEKGDIVFARTGATTGKSFLITEAPDSVFASYLIRVQITDSTILPEFVYFYFQTASYWEMVNTGISGSAQGGFNASKLSQLTIPIPPLEEQQRIVSILVEAFQNIENRVSQVEHKLHNGKEIFQSVIASILSQKGEGWSEKRLGEICEILDKFRKPITKRDRVSGEYPYYGATGIVDYVNGYIFDEKLILIGEDGAKWESGENTAFAVEGKYWVNNHAHVIRPNRSIILDNWLIYFLNMSDLTEHITGLTVPKLNQGKLRDIQIPIPPLEEQQRIVNKLDSLSQNVAFLKENHLNEIKSFIELKQSILQDAFTGKLTGGIVA